MENGFSTNQPRQGMDFAPRDAAAASVVVNTPTRQALLEDIERRLADSRGFTVATLNLDHVVKLRQSPAFRDAYQAHSHVVADGNPIVWFSRLAGQPLELVPGSDLVAPVCALAARTKAPIGLFGSTEETLDMTAQRLEAEYPGLQVAGRIAPPFGFDPTGSEADACIAQMDGTAARLWFLALGAPKQEIFAIHASRRLPRVGFLSVGAGLDFVAGHQTRAPKWVRDLKAEWVWRMSTDPVRLVPRYARCISIMPGLASSAVRTRRQSAPVSPAK